MGLFLDSLGPEKVEDLGEHGGIDGRVEVDADQIVFSVALELDVIGEDIDVLVDG